MNFMTAAEAQRLIQEQQRRIGDLPRIPFAYNGNVFMRLATIMNDVASQVHATGVSTFRIESNDSDDLSAQVAIGIRKLGYHVSIEQDGSYYISVARRLA